MSLTESQKKASRAYKQRRKAQWEQTTVWIPIGMKPEIHKMAAQLRESTKENPVTV